MKYICAQPDELYFAWQVEVMLDNFLSVGISPEDIHILVGIDKEPSGCWKKMIEKYSSVGFFFYQDTRENKVYPPSLRPHILAKHWERFPELSLRDILYHDCDIFLSRKLNLSRLLEDDIWYVSDTRSDYLSSNYISSKGDDILSNMCRIIQIPVSMVRKNDNNCGGAQYLLKNLSVEFWRLVEKYSVKLYEYLSSIDSDIQKWTSDMWAILWLAWKYNQPTNISPLLDFSWATDTWPKWDTYAIYHNAGVVPEHDGKLFRKDLFREELPYLHENHYDPQFCSYKYFEKVVQTGKQSCLVDHSPSYEDMLNQCKSIFINV